jgi:hypothetical protein
MQNSYACQWFTPQTFPNCLLSNSAYLWLPTDVVCINHSCVPTLPRGWWKWCGGEHNVECFIKLPPLTTHKHTQWIVSGVRGAHTFIYELTFVVFVCVCAVRKGVNRGWKRVVCVFCHAPFPWNVVACCAHDGGQVTRECVQVACPVLYAWLMMGSISDFVPCCHTQCTSIIILYTLSTFSWFIPVCLLIVYLPKIVHHAK